MIFRQITHDDFACVSYHNVREIPDGIDPNEPGAVIRSSGQRNAVAASLLARHGAAPVIHVADGSVGRWERRGWPVETPEGAASAAS